MINFCVIKNINIQFRQKKKKRPYFFFSRNSSDTAHQTYINVIDSFFFFVAACIIWHCLSNHVKGNVQIRLNIVIFTVVFKMYCIHQKHFSSYVIGDGSSEIITQTSWNIPNMNTEWFKTSDRNSECKNLKRYVNIMILSL